MTANESDELVIKLGNLMLRAMVVRTQLEMSLSHLRQLEEAIGALSGRVEELTA